MARSVYRSDLDGLRGLAILGVVVYHIWIGKVSGGVDIFLFLSGYFFLGSQVRGAVSPAGLKTWQSITRMLRRLWPSMILVLAFVMTLGFLLLPRLRMVELLPEFTSSILFYENWKLALSGDSYATAGQSVSPLQHMWSMAVQGQFYLAVILLCAAVIRPISRFASARAAKAVAYVIFGSTAVVSFVYANIETNQVLNYYSTFSRLWELMLGGLVALALPALSSSFRGSKVIGTVLSVSGLTGIALTGLVVNGVDVFPGWQALLPIGSAIAVVVGGHMYMTGPVTKILSSPGLVRLGSMGYSLYLWHWPLYILALTFPLAREYEWAAGAIVVAVSMILSYVTSILVESRLRQPYKPTRFKGNVVSYAKVAWRRRRQVGVPKAMASTLAIVGLVVVSSPLIGHGMMGLFSSGSLEDVKNDARSYPGAKALTEGAYVPSGVPLGPDIYDVSSMMPVTNLNGCMNTFENTEIIFKDNDGNPCVYGNPDSSTRIAAIGGSHTDHWLPALDKLGKKNDFAVEMYVKPGCVVTQGETITRADNSPYPECEEWNGKVIKHLLETHPNAVFTVTTRPEDILGGGMDQTPQGYINMWRTMQDNGIPIIGVRDNPWLTNDDGSQKNAIECLTSSGGTPETCGVVRSEHLHDVDPAIKAAADGGITNITLADLTDAICVGDYCPAAVGNIAVYRDQHHLTNAYVETLTDELWRQIGPAVEAAR